MCIYKCHIISFRFQINGPSDSFFIKVMHSEITMGQECDTMHEKINRFMQVKHILP